MTEKVMLDNRFRYDDGQLWKIDGRSGKWSCLNENKPTEHGYIQICLRIDGKMKLYMLHRLVYLFHFPEWNIFDTSPDNSIDHRDGVKANNRIENLENVNNSQNSQNITHYGGKKITGVHFCKDGRKRSWRAYWQENGKEKSKYFTTEQEALNHRREMMNQHYYCPRLGIKNI
jgi:hypothetical protein